MRLEYCDFLIGQLLGTHVDGPFTVDLSIVRHVSTNKVFYKYGAHSLSTILGFGQNSFNPVTCVLLTFLINDRIKVDATLNFSFVQDLAKHSREVILMMGYGYGWVLIFFGGLIVIGIIVLIIFLLVRDINVTGKSSYSAPPETKLENNSRALAVLAERYARGEISDEEYKQKKIEITKL